MSDEEVDRPTKKQKIYIPSYVSPIASPLADKKLTKKVLTVVTEANEKKEVKKGVKQVVKFLRRGVEKKRSLVVFGADVSPVDVISHIPIFCEEKGISYVYVPSRRDLGKASGTKRPTSVALVTLGEDSEISDDLKKVLGKVKEITPSN